MGKGNFLQCSVEENVAETRGIFIPKSIKMSQRFIYGEKSCIPRFSPWKIPIRNVTFLQVEKVKSEGERLICYDVDAGLLQPHTQCRFIYLSSFQTYSAEDREQGPGKEKLGALLGMATGTSDEVIVQISEDAANGESWMSEIKVGRNPPEHKIPKVERRLFQTQTVSNRRCFDPVMVSFGPCHYHKENLKSMKPYKDVSVSWFKKGNKCSNVSHMFVQKVEETLSSLKDCYTDDIVKDYKETDLMDMMFLDGCFILHFIHLVVNGPADDLSKKVMHLNRPLIIRDMFLLENQIPYSVLQALMHLKPECGDETLITKFIDKVFDPPQKSPLNISIWKLLSCMSGDFCCNFVSSFFHTKGDSTDGYNQEASNEGNKPRVHLLGFLRSRLIRNSANPPSFGSTGHWDFYSPPIMELQEAGIQVSRSTSRSFRDVKFKKGLINSHLELPPIIVDDSTKAPLLNLAAFEMCSYGPSDRAVTTYICFLDSLIYNPDDVKELRSKKILFNRMGSDKEVVKLFEELAKNLSPNYEAYTQIISDMGHHSERRCNHVRLWIGQCIRTHFTSPWTVISLIAAISVIGLTLVQTVYTCLSNKK